jgi:hypothetical protein
MRRATALLVIVGLAITTPSLAMPPGVPDPVLSDVALSPSAAPCQYRFRADAMLDDLVITSTVLDSFGVPVVGCLVTVTLVPLLGSPLCVCAPCNPQAAVTDGFGVAASTFSKVGGHGILTASVEACGVVIGAPVIPFTSPDLDASCELLPMGATTLVDLALFASGLPPGYEVWIDYNCSGMPINVVDLGIFAGGVGKGCDGLCP